MDGWLFCSLDLPEITICGDGCGSTPTHPTTTPPQRSIYLPTHTAYQCMHVTYACFLTIAVCLSVCRPVWLFVNGSFTHEANERLVLHDRHE